MKIKKTIAALSVMAATAMFSNVAIAEAVAYENGSAITATIPPYGVTIDRTFKGRLTMARTSLPKVTCDATFEGYVTIAPNGLTGTITVDGITLKNVLPTIVCGGIIIGVPFTSAPISASSLKSLSTVEGDVDATFEDVTVSLCNSGNPSEITVQFNNEADTTQNPLINSAPSRIIFDDAPLIDTTSFSNCSISGSLLVDGVDLDIIDQ